MGACMTQQNNDRHKIVDLNPIKNIFKQWSIENLKNNWSSNELQYLNSYLKNKQKYITINQFFSLFVRFQNYCQQTKKNIYKLFNVSGNGILSKQQLIDVLTLIRHIQKNQVMIQIIIFLYSTTNDKKTLILTDLELFMKENISQLYDISNNQIIREQYISFECIENSKKNILSVDYQQISKIFEYYDLDKFKELFQFNMREEQIQLIKKLKSQGIWRKNGDKVYLLEYQWFMKWSYYVKDQYSLQIKPDPASNVIHMLTCQNTNNDENIDQNSSSSNSNDNSNLKINQQIKKYKKPLCIKNQILQGNSYNHLRQCLFQYVHYILLPEWIWNRLVIIYGGGPSINRIYPNIYTKIVVKVFLNNLSRFIPNRMENFLEHQIKHSVQGFFHNVNKLNYFYYYKNEGGSNWQKIKDPTLQLSSILHHRKTYIVCVMHSRQLTFLDLYNVKMKNGVGTIRKRIKNYGQKIQVGYNGILQNGFVVSFTTEKVMVEVISDDYGTFEAKQFYIDSIRKLNPNEINCAKYMNCFPGMYNLGNTCFINAILQCLIRTPLFGAYLQKQKQNYNKNDKLLLYELFKIYQKIKNIPNVIQMHSFKKCLDKHFPFFQGHSQHDAQEFLICLIQKISQQIRQMRKFYGEQQNLNCKVNQKIVRFFSGKIKNILTCVECQNSMDKIDHFFTFSVGLPEINQRDIDYIYIAKYGKGNWAPKKFGLTCKKNITIKQFLGKVSKQQQLQSNQSLYSTTVVNNQWLNNLQNQSDSCQIALYINFGIKIVCYEIDMNLCPTYQDFLRRLKTEKTVKFEVQQRMFEERRGRYKAFFVPFLLEINSQMTFDQAEAEINEMIRHFIDQQYLLQQHSVTSHNPELQKKRTNEKFSHVQQTFFNKNQFLLQSYRSVIQNKNDKKKQLIEKNQNIDLMPINSYTPQNLPYVIRIIRNDVIETDRCALCRRKFRIPTKIFQLSGNINQFCSGCQFKRDLPLFHQYRFSKFANKITFVVDWRDILSTRNLRVYCDPSYYQAIQRQTNRQFKLQHLLSNYQNEQLLEYKCQSPHCIGNTAKRTDQICLFPNILLLHFKRFKYDINGMNKITSNILYPDLLKLSKDVEYQLYGVVVHLGTIFGGHYYSYVKMNGKWYLCNDQIVTQCDQKDIITPNAYILFYKKVDFDPSLICLQF